MPPNDFARACDREPIHIPGAVQPFGVMVVCDPDDTVTAVSSNCAEVFGMPPDAVLGQFGATLQPVCGKLSWHEHEGKRIGEVEPTPAYAGQEPSNDALRAGVTRSLQELDTALDVRSLCARVVHHIQSLSGFERVMLYRFDNDWHGEVVAEAVMAGADSYLGQRFPSSDIPAQARAMLAVNRVRMIPNAGYQPVPLVAHPGQPPVDMGMSLLRSVSPVHLEYLANMDVGASLTLSIVCDQRLWGLIACHHRTPLYVSRVARDSCEIVARLMSSLLVAKSQMEEDHTRQRLHAVNAKLQQHISKGDDFIVGLVRHQPNILDLVLSDGCSAAICFDDRWTLLGDVPSVPELRDLLAWLWQNHATDEVFFTAELPHLYPAAKHFANRCCGLMAVSLPKREGDYVLWFLPELVQTIPWAGRPEKTLDQDGCGLHPRKSFRLWTEILRGRSRKVTPTELSAAAHLRKAIVEADLDRQFQREREARNQMTRERHRLAFLAEAGAVLSEGLDPQSSLTKFAQLATQSICEWCVIYLQHDGNLQREVICHATPQGQVVAEGLRDFPGLQAAPTQSPLRDVFEKRETVLIGRVTPTWCDRIAPTPAYSEFLQRQLGISSVVCVALVARDELLGVLKLAWSTPSMRYTSDDVPWLKELARRLAHTIDNAQLYQRSQQAIQAREHVLGVVSHDLRNPLGAIQLNTERLQRLISRGEVEDLAPRSQMALERIEKSCRRMRGLVEDVLNVARLEAGTLALEKTAVPADALLQDVVDMLEPLASDRSVHLEVRNHASDCAVVCEPERLMQVFSNLVGNAIKFTPAGGDVVVELAASDTPTFTVRDTGPGIALADQAHIFDRFWQANRTTRHGAGLGLAIAKGIVEAHGGEIWVQSQEGRGTSFYFTVPS